MFPKTLQSLSLYGLSLPKAFSCAIQQKSQLFGMLPKKKYMFWFCWLGSFKGNCVVLQTLD